jgi:hypothetical protein
MSATRRCTNFVCWFSHCGLQAASGAWVGAYGDVIPWPRSVRVSTLTAEGFVRNHSAGALLTGTQDHLQNKVDIPVTKRLQVQAQHKCKDNTRQARNTTYSMLGTDVTLNLLQLSSRLAPFCWQTWTSSSSTFNASTWSDLTYYQSIPNICQCLELHHVVRCWETQPVTNSRWK